MGRRSDLFRLPGFYLSFRHHRFIIIGTLRGRPTHACDFTQYPQALRCVMDSPRSTYADDEASSIEPGTTEFGEDGRSSPTYSYHSSVDGAVLLREVHGRTLNNIRDQYVLPADVPEHARLDLQHEMLKIKLGGLFLQPRAVHRALASRNSSTPAVLDVGSGSGSWVVDMGDMFPHAEVVGVDLTPANLSRRPPPNCRFECDDVNLGLSHYKNSFDVVHARCVETGIADYPHFLKEVHQVLRPGGIFLSVFGSSKMLGEDFEPCVRGDVNPNAPPDNNTATLLAGFHEAARARGAETEIFLYVRGWLESMKSAWSLVGETTFYIPVGPWQENMTDKDRHIATLMGHDIARLLASTRPSLLAYGYPEQVVDSWIEKAEDELRNTRKKMYVRWVCTWAIKPGTPGDE